MGRIPAKVSLCLCAFMPAFAVRLLIVFKEVLSVALNSSRFTRILSNLGHLAFADFSLQVKGRYVGAVLCMGQRYGAYHLSLLQD